MKPGRAAHAAKASTPATTLSLAGSAILLSMFSGCSQPDPQFVSNEMLLVDLEIVPAHQQQIDRVLTQLFGTPNQALVPDDIELDIQKLRMASGPVGYAKRADGQEYLQQGLYRQHCATCHGVTGDGYGPAASMLEPYPRDFRPGIFKWKSTYLAAKPTDADLQQVLKHGLPGTAMPSFALLTDEQLDSLVEYVKYLAMRGQVERKLIAAIGDEFDFDPMQNSTDDPLDPEYDPADQQLIDQIVTDVAANWREASDRVLEPQTAYVPPADRTAKQLQESIKSGRRLLLSTRAKCTDCHDQTGTPVAVKELDSWNQAVADFERSTASLAANIERRESQLATLSAAQQQQAAKRLELERHRLQQRERVLSQLLAPQPAYSRSLQRGIYRGGDQPIDLFRRLHQGVAGSPMPGQGGVGAGENGALSEPEMWSLVDFLLQHSPPSK